jgi:transposase
LHSPYDEEARFSAKREQEWVGYKVHLSETCEEKKVHAITEVTTTLATQADMATLDTIHTTLADKDLLPKEHLLDAGYVDGEALVSAPRDLGVTLISPVKEIASWQAKAGEGFDLGQFAIDWENHRVTCPLGQTSAQWCERHTQGRKDAIQVRFSATFCQACPSREQCTRAKSGARTITFLPEDQHKRIQQARREQNTPEFRKSMLGERGLKGPFLKGYAAMGYESRVMSGWLKPISRCWRLRPRSTSTVCLIGGN